jgi:hypothetical protein
LEQKAIVALRCKDVEYESDRSSCTTRPFTEDRWRSPRPDTKPLNAAVAEAEAQACRDKRFLLYTRSLGDFYAGHRHKMQVQFSLTDEHF